MSNRSLKHELAQLIDKQEYSHPEAFIKSFKLHAQAFSTDSQYPLHTDELASCLKYIIISSDLIDDIQDGEPHIKALSEKEFGNCLNQSITLLMLTLGKLHHICNRDTYDIIMTYLLKAMEGQYLDVNNMSNTIDDYLHMIKLKSGSLIALTNLLGASLSTSEHQDIIANYSLYLGASAQIANDIEDVFNFDSKSDWKYKRKTLPILYMLSPELSEAKLIHDYYNGDISYEQFCSQKDDVIELIHRLGAIPFSKYYKNRMDKQAKDLINQLVIDNDKKSLLINKLLQNERR